MKLFSLDNSKKFSGFECFDIENVQQGKSSSGSEMEVTWEDQQNINTFSRFNNRFHELEDDIKLAKVTTLFSSMLQNVWFQIFYFEFLHCL